MGRGGIRVPFPPFLSLLLSKKRGRGTNAAFHLGAAHAKVCLQERVRACERRENIKRESSGRKIEQKVGISVAEKRAERASAGPRVCVRTFAGRFFRFCFSRLRNSAYSAAAGKKLVRVYVCVCECVREEGACVSVRSDFYRYGHRKRATSSDLPRDLFFASFCSTRYEVARATARGG